MQNKEKQRPNPHYSFIFPPQIGPGMSHDLELLVEVPEGVGLCRLTLRLRGRNLACVQGGDWYRGERFSWLNTSRLHYEPDEVNVTRARLTFFGITNAGGLYLLFLFQSIVLKSQ